MIRFLFAILLMADIYVTPTGSDAGSGTSGSPFATWGKAVGVMSGGDRVLVKGPGTYTQSVNSSNVSGGYVAPPAGVVGTGMSQIVGYNVTPGDLDEVDASSSLHPVLQGYSGSANLFQAAASNIALRNVVLDGASHVTNVCNFNSGAGCLAQNVKVINPGTSCFRAGANSCVFIRCLALGGTNGFSLGSASNNLLYCVADGYSSLGFGVTGTQATNACTRCIARLGTGTAQGFLLASNSALIQCISYKNGGDGFGLTGTSLANMLVRSSILYGNGGYGINQGSATIFLPYPFNYNAYGSNTSGDYSNASFAGAKDITGIADPFVSGSGTINILSDAWTNFALSSGGKTALAAKGYPPYLDIGTVQHQDAGGGGLLLPRGFSGGYAA